jgi:hypothetical protein
MAEEQGPQREYIRKYGQLVAKAWLDPEFKEQLMANPEAILREQGIDVPEEINPRVVEKPENEWIFFLPPKPASISDEQLTQSQAGLAEATSSSDSTNCASSSDKCATGI